MSLFVDVTWHHLGEGERFGVGLRGSKGSAAINPLTVWKELHGVPVDVSPTGSGSRENAFTASYRAEWAHFEAAIAGEAKVPVAAGPPGAAQGGGRDLPLGAGRARRGAVRLRGAAGRHSLLTAESVPVSVQPRREGTASPGSELRVYLMTMGPGAAGLGAVRAQRDLDR